MAIGLLATITVLEGKNGEFEQTFLDLTEKVRANEPGNVFYALHKKWQRSAGVQGDGAVRQPRGARRPW